MRQGVLKLAGWFALAYLGYWAVQFLDRLLVPLVIFPLAGAPVSGWLLTPFRAVVRTSELNRSPGAVMFLSLLPLLLDTLFLIVMAAAGHRIRSTWARITLHFAALWTILLLASQVAVLAYFGRGRLAPLAGPPPLSPARRIAWAAAASLLLLAAGRPVAGRLLAEARSARAPARYSWLALAALIVPVVAILLGASGILAAIHWWGPRVAFYLVAPAGACLAVALLGLTSKPRRLSPDGLGNSGAVAAVCVAAVLYAGLAQASRAQAWLAEQHLQTFSSFYYQILYDPKFYAAESIRAFAGEHERVLANEAARLHVSLDAGSPGQGTETNLRVVLYPDLASLHAATGSNRLYSVDGLTIRATLGGYVARLDPAADAAALLTAVWGRPGSARMAEWVAHWLAGEWRGRALDEWAAQIEHEVGHYKIAQLADSSSDAFLSPLVRQPLGAAWVGTVFDRAGLAAVRRLYATKTGALDAATLAAQLGITPVQLEQDWQQWTAAKVSHAPADLPAVRALDSGFFFRGISFSHEGWSGRGGGYISAEADAELQQLSLLGANAIAVVPYGFARGTPEEAISYTDTDETDEQLTHALNVAHSLGMKVMLKPQLWVTHGEFTGAIRFDDPAVRKAWMRRYREFMLHYARLAELERFDLLSIGSELEGLTPYEDDWRRLIAEVRGVYHGPITYAANWGHEFESIAFWDALDYAGVNDYYPLQAAPAGAGSAPARVEDLLLGAEHLADKLEALSHKWHKPILFTEVGYPSVRGGASEPWIEDGDRSINPGEQAAAYEAAFRAFSGRQWFRGMFWWKWPSSGRGGGPDDASYTPLGKPAEEVLRAWFMRLAGASKAASPRTP